MANGPVGVLPPAPGTSVPGWLQPVVQVTTTLGVPTVFAGILLWFVLTRLGATMDVIQHDEDDRVRIIAAMQDTIIAALDRQSERYEKAMHENMELNRTLADRYERVMQAHEGHP